MVKITKWFTVFNLLPLQMAKNGCMDVWDIQCFFSVYKGPCSMFSPAMKMWAFVTCLQHDFMAQLLYICIHNGWWVQGAVHDNLGFKIKQTLRCSTIEFCTVNIRVWKVKQRLGVFNLHSSEYQAGGHCTGCTKKSSCIEVYEKDDTLLLAWFIKLVNISSTACFKWIITQHDAHYVQKQWLWIGSVISCTMLNRTCPFSSQKTSW